MSKKQTVVILDVKTPSMARAIRAKCLNCSGYQRAEVRDCVLTDCPLFPYAVWQGAKGCYKQPGKILHGKSCKRRVCSMERIRVTREQMKAVTDYIEQVLKSAELWNTMGDIAGNENYPEVVEFMKKVAVREELKADSMRKALFEIVEK